MKYVKFGKNPDSKSGAFCAVALATVFGVFASCTKDALDESAMYKYGARHSVNVRGIMESGLNTDKAHMDVDSRYVYWDNNDSIRINNAILTASTETASDTLANFAGDVSANTRLVSGKDCYRAVFPYYLAESIDNSTSGISVTLPEQQPFTNGRPKTNFMAAYLTVEEGCREFTMPFRNICSMMKIGLRANPSASNNANTVRQIILSSTTNSLSGSAVLTFNASGTPTLSMGNDGGIVSLDCTNNGSGGILLTSEPTYFYLMVPAYTGELSMMVINKDGKGMSKKVSSFEFKRNFVYTSDATMDINSDDPHIFELCDGTKINIAKGNLQYNRTDGFRFAEHSYTMIAGAETDWREGYSEWQPRWPTSVLTENNKIANRAQTEWIDMFGWGTSGYDCGNNARLNKPWSSDWAGYVRDLNGGRAMNEPYDYKGGAYNGADWHAGYGPEGNHDLTGTYANCDWGVYNDIKSYDGTVTYTKGTWRTPTKEEWDCLINKREKYGYAQIIGNGHEYTNVNGFSHSLSGVVLVPEGFIDPKVGGNAFVSAATSTTWHFTDNKYTEAQWAEMEKAGAVFLPAAGLRGNLSVQDASCVGHGGIKACYWSSTCCTDPKQAYYFRIENEQTTGKIVGARTEPTERSGGACVRLIKNAD